MKKMKMNKKILGIISFSEIFMMILSSFAFAFMIASAIGVASVVTIASTPTVSAASNGIAKECCQETIEGARCQEMTNFDKAMCKTSLIPSGCDTLDACQKGCCFDSNSGVCSTNAPKQKCLDNGGNWSNNDLCNIDECELGCCVLGKEVTLTTSTECSKLGKQYKFTKNFQAPDMNGGCAAYQDLGKQGACLTPSEDYSGENNCKFTTKENCLSDKFYLGYLCSSAELKTTCKPTTNTKCIDWKDEIYFIDSCGNQANIYDSSKVNDSAYWSRIVSKSESCASGGKDCGNCDYLSGSICYEVRKNKDESPSYGNNVCRNLDCANERKHGESWCISDYNQDKSGVSPVGSRFFRGVCMDGEITIEPCADFNQEICTELTGSSGYTQAKCQVNEWRSCLVANDQETYFEVEDECKKYDQCMMFLEQSYDGPTSFGNLSFNLTNGSAPWLGMLGNIKDNFNMQGGKVGDAGKDNNKGYVYCVPKYTPGMVFWQDEAKKSSAISTNSGTSKLGSSYGGSIAETSAICSLGGYTSLAKTNCKSPLLGCGWNDKENWQFNSEAREGSNRVQALNNYIPIIMMGLNEKCRMIGTCGEQVNIAGELGANSNNLNDTISRIKVDRNGDVRDKRSIAGYDYPSGYLDYLKEISGLKIMGSIKKITDALLAGKTAGTEGESAEGQIGTRATDTEIMDTSSEAQSAVDASAAAGRQKVVNNAMGAFQGASAIATGAGIYQFFGGAVYGGSSATGGTTGAGAVGNMVIVAAVAAVAGYQLGKYIAKQSGMSPGKTTAFIGVMIGVIVAAAMIISAIYFATSLCAFGPWGCIVGAIIAVLYAIYSLFTGEDNEYYITQYSCNVWEPPAKGNCDVCNTDVRPCSEYRCKALGKNCQYFNDLGEPGYCSQIKDTGSAIISPWQNALSSGLVYSDITGMSFSIKNSNSQDIDAWQGIEFGIMTDKQTECKIDSRHTSSYDEMGVDFTIDNSDESWTQGTHHKIAISPFVTGNGTATSTLSMKPGENNYYIRCKNFAGSYNLAEYAVKINVGNGPDLTPPSITGFNPGDRTYLSNTANSSIITLFVNEPSECRYSRGEDKLYADMTGKLNCLNNYAILGNWPCMETLTNLSAGENKFYFQCKDHPEYANRSEESRNLNKVSKIYTLNVCDQGLEIKDISPKNKLVAGKSPLEIDLKVETKGCINGGDAVCSYGINNSNYIQFETTGTISHSQKFTSIIPGKYNISIMCEDGANNVAYGNAVFEFNADNSPPQIIRHYDADRKLIIITDENSICKYTQNTSLGCGYDFNDNSLIPMTGSSTYHSAPGSYSKEYFIRCQDAYNNTNVGCGADIKDEIIK